MINKKVLNNKIYGLISLINEAFQNELYDLALKLLYELIEIDSNFYKAYHLIGFIIYKTNNDEEKLKEALNFFNKSIELNKYYLLNYYHKYKAQEKLSEINKNTNTNKNNIEIDTQYLKDRANNFLIRKHLKNFYKSPLYFYNKNKLLLNSSSEVIKYIKKFNNGMIQYNYSDIIENCCFIIESDKQNFNAYNIRGFIKYILKEYDDALEDLNKSIEINNKNSEAYYNIAKIEYSLKNYNEALNFFNKSKNLYIRQENKTALDILKCEHYIAWCYYHLDNDERIFANIEIDDSIDDLSESYYNIGKLKYVLRCYDEALKNFNNVYESCKNYQKSKYYKIICNYKINNDNIKINDYIISMFKLIKLYKIENDFNFVQFLCNNILENANDDYIYGLVLYELFDISFNNELKEKAYYYLNKAKEKNNNKKLMSKLRFLECMISI